MIGAWMRPRVIWPPCKAPGSKWISRKTALPIHPTSTAPRAHSRPSAATTSRYAPPTARYSWRAATRSTPRPPPRDHLGRCDGRRQGQAVAGQLQARWRCFCLHRGRPGRTPSDRVPHRTRPDPAHVCPQAPVSVTLKTTSRLSGALQPSPRTRKVNPLRKLRSSWSPHRRKFLCPA